MSDHNSAAPRSDLGRLRRVVAVALVAVLVLTGCEAAFDAPARTTGIEKVDEQVLDGWHYEYFRNLAYPCSLEGHQTFVIGTPVGLADEVERPLWVRLRGGGSGWFDPGEGDPALRAQPDDSNMAEEEFNFLRNRLRNDVLTQRVVEGPTQFRGLAVSMCNRDTYGGANNPDPHNFDPDGTQRTTNGLLATKAAIQFTMARHATSDYFLHGGSAGSHGTFHVGWSLETQGMPPAGLVADSGVRNDAWQAARIAQDVCSSRYGGPEWEAAFAPRVHSALRTPDAQPHELVASGELTVPIVHLWNQGDRTSCGDRPMVCDVPGGSVTMGAADCRHESLRAAIAAEGPDSRSLSLGVCVTEPESSWPCNLHVVTRSDLPNSDPAYPADYQQLIVDWVQERLDEAEETTLGQTLACPWDAADPQRRVFVVVGDDDAAAVGADGSALPAPLATPDERLTTWDGETWAAVDPGADGSFGSELSFASTLLTACPDAEIGLVKHTSVGSTMASWGPGGADRAVMAGLLTGALTSGVPVSIEGLVVHQGVVDGATFEDATAWSERFTAAVTSLRDSAGIPDDLPAFVVTERRGPLPADLAGADLSVLEGLLWDGPHRAHVLAAQWEVQHQLAGVTTVVVRDPARIPGTDRHATRGVRAVGRALAVAYVGAAGP
ncbi:MAG: hypothetical protein JJU45_11885 [Acidimicrobiia bacterium]|nr:hypothetical protein [Acidimicrobiia bacterium]